MTTHTRFIQGLFTATLDLIFPPSEEERLVRTVSEAELVARIRPILSHGITSLFEFHSPLVRALIHEAKFHGNERAFILLGFALSEHLRSSGDVPDAYIVPIPLSPKRMKKRGYNQVTEVVRRALKGKNSGVLCEDLLVRSRDTRPQTELRRAERLTNVDDAFAVSRSSLVTGKHILLIDDVTTTGATLHAAKAALSPHAPASIRLLALAH